MSAGPPSASAAPAPRARRGAVVGEQTRVAILEAAVEAFSENGYATTTLEAIARRVGVTRPGVLHHFSSKEALFAAVVEDQGRWAYGQLRSAASGLDGLRALRALVTSTPTERHRLRLVQVLQGEAMSGNAAAHRFATQRLVHVRAHVHACLSHARAAGQVPGDVDLERLATSLAGAVNGLQAQWLLDSTVDTGSAFDELVDQLVSPTSTPPPPEETP